jgi:glycosyltransferase involved in cell wall biosynthesis
MKIVHVAASLEDEAGGPAYIIPALVSSLAHRGNNLSLFSIGPTGQTYDRGFNWHKFSNDAQGFPILRKLQASSKMKSALQSLEANLIHTHGLWLMPHIYGSQVKLRTERKLITTFHGMLAPEALRYSQLQKRIFGLLLQNKALAASDMFHATSLTEVDDIRRAGWRQPIALIPLGIDVPNKIARKTNQHPKTILYLGRIHPIKRLGDLIKAWRDLASSHPTWRVLIVGPDEGQELERLKQMIAEQNVQRVEFAAAAFGAEKSKVYTEADLYILPSQSENFSITVAEALAFGLPVICSKGAPWAELEKNKCGWWSDIGHQGLKIALGHALNCTAAELVSMGERGRDWMLRDFSLQSMAEKMEHAYQWLLLGGAKPDFIHLFEERHV